MKRVIKSSVLSGSPFKSAYDAGMLEWMEGLTWSIDWHTFTIVSVDEPNKTCKVTEEWIAEDSGKNCKETHNYTINKDESDAMFIADVKYPKWKMYLNSANNYERLVPIEFNEIYHLFEDDDADGVEDDDDYTPSSTAGDYSPSSPWNAPGMSVRDFI